MQQADSGQVKDGAFDPVAFAEVAGRASHLPDQFGNRRVNRVQVDHDDQNGLLGDPVLALLTKAEARASGHAAADSPCWD